MNYVRISSESVAFVKPVTLVKSGHVSKDMMLAVIDSDGQVLHDYF